MNTKTNQKNLNKSKWIKWIKLIQNISKKIKIYPSEFKWIKNESNMSSNESCTVRFKKKQR